MTTLLASQVGENHFEIAAELPEDLAARAARRRRRVRIGDDGNPTELSMSFRERLEHRHTLGAYRQAVRRVLDVATRDDLAIGGLERCADLEPRERGVRVAARAPRRRDEFVRGAQRFPPAAR